MDLKLVQFQFWSTVGINGLSLHENVPFFGTWQSVLVCSISCFCKYAPYPYFHTSHWEEHSRLSFLHSCKPKVFVQNSQSPLVWFKWRCVRKWRECHNCATRLQISSRAFPGDTWPFTRWRHIFPHLISSNEECALTGEKLFKQPDRNLTYI